MNIYSDLRKKNDSENIYEKSFYYTKLLFFYYSKMLVFDKENKISSDIINKIKEEIVKFINDDIENLIESFEDLKKEKIVSYVEIILFIVETLYKEGKRLIEEKKMYANYYSKKIYKKAQIIKSYIDNIKLNFKLKEKINDFEEQYGKDITSINDFIYATKEKMRNKKSKFLPNKTGLTRIYKKLNNLDDVYFQLDIFKEMIDE